MGAHPQVGEVLGAYVLKRLLGVGGMGLVYLAEHDKLKRKVALKLLRPELTTDPVAIRRFFAEARAVNEIAHENIVEVTDFVDQGEHRYFVMELLKGHALGDVLMKERLPLLRTMHIARQIADALAAAHEAGVVHRDLKPQNVFLIKRGVDPDFVKVLDFGIAKVRGMEGDVEQTAAGTFVGTPAYMAPEQLADKPCDHRVDVYSFGILFYELVTGLRPFRAMSVGEIIVQQLTWTPPKPSVLYQENGGTGVIPDKLERFLLALIEKDPTKRVQTMRDVLNVIDELTPLVAGLAKNEGYVAPRVVDTTGDYALPSAAGWVAVNKASIGLTSTEGAPLDEPDFADLDDVIDASADAVAMEPVKALPKAAAPISFAPLPPLPPLPLSPLAAKPPMFTSPPAASVSPRASLDDASKPILVGRPITESGSHAAAPGNSANSANGGNGANDANGSNGSHAAVLGSGRDEVSAPNATSIDGVLPAMVVGVGSRVPTPHTMALSGAPGADGPEALAQPRSRRGIAIAAVLAVVAVIAIAVVWSGGDEQMDGATTPPSTPLVVVAAPVDAPPVNAPPVDAARVDAPPPPVDAPPVDAPVDAPVDTPVDTPVDAPPVDVQPDEPVDAIDDPAAPKKAARVSMSFKSKPAGASVVVGGKTLGTTPLTMTVIESNRPVAVAFKLEGFEAKTVSARFLEGATVNAALVEVKKDETKGTAKDGALINPFKKKPK